MAMMFQQPSTIVTTLLLSIATGQHVSHHPQTQRIVGGTEVSSQDVYPFFVALEVQQFGGSYSAFCGASLLSPTIVLSAAHCNDPFPNLVSQATVRRNAYHFSENVAGNEKEERSAITAAFVHPSYNVTLPLAYDFMLLAVLSPSTTPTVFATINSCEVDLAGRSLTTIGLGHTTNGGSSPSTLREVTVPGIADSTCGSWPSGIRSLGPWSAMVCAGRSSGGVDSCQGDSGGPLFYRNGTVWQQVGVTSFGRGCALPFSPGVYSQPESVYSWIQCIMSDPANSAQCDSAEADAKAAIVNTFIANSRSGQIGRTACDGSPETEDIVITVSPAPSDSSDSNNGGIIAGAVIGGIVVLAITAAFFCHYFCCRNEQAHAANSQYPAAANQPYAASPQQYPVAQQSTDPYASPQNGAGHQQQGYGYQQQPGYQQQGYGYQQPQHPPVNDPHSV